MTKPLRDSKGRFVSRESKVEELKFYISVLKELLPPSEWGPEQRSFPRAIRQLRLDCGIYETF